MKNLNALYSDCVRELLSIGMDISDHIVSVSINKRLSRALGRCILKTQYGEKLYSIEVQPCMLEDSVEERTTKNTIIHELIHTCPGAFNHGYEFQRRARQVNALLGYSVSTTTDVSVLASAGVTLKQPHYRYACVCTRCGQITSQYQRWCRKLEYAENWRHTSCHAPLTVVSLDPHIAIVSAHNMR